MDLERAGSAGESRFRDHAANERTLLAWIRTGIALITFGFAISRFGLFLRGLAAAGNIPATRVHEGMGSSWSGVALVVLGMLTNAAALRRYNVVRRAIESGGPYVPSPVLVWMLGVGSVAVAIAMAVLLGVALGE
jgi:putative membrane protein